MVKIIYSTYAKSKLGQVAMDATQINTKKRNMIPGLLNKFDNLFGGNMEKWDTDPVDLELNLYSKPIHF